MTYAIVKAADGSTYVSPSLPSSLREESPPPSDWTRPCPTRKS